MIRLFTWAKLDRVLDLEDSLPFVAGVVMALVVGTGTFVASVPLTRDAVRGTNMVEEGLCWAFGGQVCHRVAGLTADEEMRAQRVLDGCATGAPAICVAEGFAQNGIDSVSAALHWQAACEGRDAQACTNLGVSFQQGHGISHSFSDAADHYWKGCELGSAHGCTNLGNLYRWGHGVARDRGRADELFREGCDAGIARACRALGNRYQPGPGLAENATERVESFSWNCDLGNTGDCYHAGFAFQWGQGVARDSIQAINFYRRSCDLGDGEGCLRISEMGHVYLRQLEAAERVCWIDPTDEECILLDRTMIAREEAP